MDVGSDIRIRFDPAFDDVDCKVAADLGNHLRIGTGRGGHAEDERVFGGCGVTFGDEDVGVVADGAVAFVNDRWHSSTIRRDTSRRL